MARRYAPPLIFPAVKAHTATIIFSHGLGDTGAGWAGQVENWRRRQRLDEVKFILPNAPQIPITCNMGYRMPGWFDIKVLDGSIDTLLENEDAEGIRASAEYLSTLIQQEVDSGILPERIALGGFSQGAAMSIFTGLTSKWRLAGIVSVSGWLLLSRSFSQVLNDGPNMNQATPILMCQGDSDRLVRPEASTISYRILNVNGLNVKHKEYAGVEHSTSPEEMDDVENFLTEILPPKEAKEAEEGKSEL